jgi:CRISPR-associated endonuclease/helicase Cas3
MLANDFWAHTVTDPASGLMRKHLLVDHLQAVASLAEGFAGAWGGEWARLAGLWHDLGKFRPGFQAYIRQVNDQAHLEGKLPASSDKTHSAAGALLALRHFEQRYGPDAAKLARVLAHVIAGHHAGLADWTAGLDKRLLGTDAPAAQKEHDQALAASQAAAPDLAAWPMAFDLRLQAERIPGVRSGNPLAWSLWTRMLFSALVDADFLDTEAFMEDGRQAMRGGFAPLTHYQTRLDEHLAAMAQTVQQAGRSQDPVMQARAQVLAQCRAKAALPPGVFRLAVPTGGGKTLSSLAFALAHAGRYGHRQVIYAIPYTSIIEQTGEVFAGIFGRDAVLEHHSQAEGDASQESARSRLACENWDAPLVVTTNVQLFESLFARRTSRCRKLHRIAGSVIVLDEAQLLPPDFLQPILDTLNLLVRHYGVTLLLCTATQPTLVDMTRFDPKQSLRGLPPATALIDDEASLFAALKRVQLQWPADLQTPLPTPTLVADLAALDCVLTIVNTRADAAEIVAALDAATGDTTLHLSAAMCGQHRADVIAGIRQRLVDRRSGADARPLRVVSTQLVEAGVDIDFPVVYRALAGLDSIAQAAGRCNREGLLQRGRVVVFVREVPKALAPVRAGVEATRSTLVGGLDDALSPAAFERYFPQYYNNFPSRDKHGVVQDLDNRSGEFAMSFATAADKFKLVDDQNQATVLVPYRSPRPGAPDTAPLIQRLRKGDTDRWLLRKLQRYTVTLRQHIVDAWQARGDVKELQPGLYLLVDELRYDERLGLLPEGQALDAAALVP